MLKFVFDDIKAIAHAELELADITVVTGNNATGKSTMAEVVEAFVSTTADYNVFSAAYIVYGKILSCVSAFGRFFRNLSRDEDYRYFEIQKNLSRRNKNYTDSSGQYYGQESISTYSVEHFFWKKITNERVRFNQILDGVQERLLAELDAYLLHAKPKERFLEQLAKELRVPCEEMLDRTLPEVVADIFKSAKERYDELEKTRDILVAPRTFLQALPINNVKVYEDGEKLFPITNSSGGVSVGVCASLEKALYLRSPYYTNISKKDGLWRKDGLPFTASSQMEAMADCILNDYSSFIGGEISWDEQNDQWVYQEKDASGRYFQLSECATGIRAIADFIKLEKLGLLDAQTVLILDEPEAHLHPEWIVKYATLLVQAVKHYGIHLFVATHSPMMTLALHDIAVAEDLEDKFKCYKTAFLKDGSCNAELIPLGTDIAPIFEAFNVAYNLVEDYEPLNAVENRKIKNG